MGQLWATSSSFFEAQSLTNSEKSSGIASKPHEFGSLSNCRKSLGHSGITVPSGDCLRANLGNPSGALTLTLSAVSPPSTLSLGDSFSTQPLGFLTVAFRLSKPLVAVWDLAVQTLGLPQGTFSRLFHRESLKLPIFVCFIQGLVYSYDFTVKVLKKNFDKKGSPPHINDDYTNLFP